MKDELISFETAKLAKEKGCRLTVSPALYNQDGEFGSPYKETYPAYTQSLLQRWLREVHDLHLEPKLANQESKKSYYYGVYKWEEYRAYIKGTNKRFDTYEQALEAGLLEALKLI